MLITQLLNGLVDPLSVGLVHLVHDLPHELLCSLLEVAYVIEKAFTQSHGIFQISVSRHQISPVVLELQVPTLLLLLGLLLLKIEGCIVVTVNVVPGFVHLRFGVLILKLLVTITAVIILWALVGHSPICVVDVTISI